MKNSVIRIFYSLIIYLILSVVCISMLAFFNYNLYVFFNTSNIIILDIALLASIYIILIKIAGYCINVSKLKNLKVFRIGTIMCGFIIIYFVLYVESMVIHNYNGKVFDIYSFLDFKENLISSPYRTAFISKTGVVEITMTYVLNYINIIILVVIICSPKGKYSLEGNSLVNRFSSVNTKCFISKTEIKSLSLKSITECIEIDYNDRYDNYYGNYMYALFVMDDKYYIIKEVKKRFGKLTYSKSYTELKLK